MTLLYITRYTRAYIKAHPDWIFVFGDNLARSGYGGQAAAARGELNTVGIATKRSPSMEPSAFLTDVDYEEWGSVESDKLATLVMASRNNRTIIWPFDGIGTGLAKLETSAPMIWSVIEKLRLAIQ